MGIYIFFYNDASCERNFGQLELEIVFKRKRCFKTVRSRVGEGRRLRKAVFRAFYFGNAGGYVGGAESCVECALWTASGNPSVVNHPSLPIHFLDRVEERYTIEKLAPRNSHLACALHSRKLDEFRKKNEIKSYFSLHDKFSKRFLNEIFQSIIFPSFLKQFLKYLASLEDRIREKFFYFSSMGARDFPILLILDIWISVPH